MDLLRAGIKQQHIGVRSERRKCNHEPHRGRLHDYILTDEDWRSIPCSGTNELLQVRSREVGKGRNWLIQPGQRAG